MSQQQGHAIDADGSFEPSVEDAPFAEYVATSEDAPPAEDVSLIENALSDEYAPMAENVSPVENIPPDDLSWVPASELPAAGVNELQEALRAEFSPPDERASLFRRGAENHGANLGAFCTSSMQESADLRAAMSEICQSMADIASTTRQDVSAVNSQIELSKASLIIVAAELAEGRDRLASAEAGLKKMADDAPRHWEEIAAVDSRVARIEPHLSELREYQDKTGLRVDALHAAVEGLQEVVDPINAKLNMLLKATDRIADYQQQADQAAEKLLKLQTAMAGLTELFEAERNLRDRLGERLRQAEAQLNTMEEREIALFKWQKRVSQVMRLATAP